MAESVCVNYNYKDCCGNAEPSSVDVHCRRTHNHAASLALASLALALALALASLALDNCIAFQVIRLAVHSLLPADMEQTVPY